MVGHGQLLVHISKRPTSASTPSIVANIPSSLVAKTLDKEPWLEAMTVPDLEVHRPLHLPLRRFV